MQPGQIASLYPDAFPHPPDGHGAIKDIDDGIKKVDFQLGLIQEWAMDAVAHLGRYDEQRDGGDLAAVYALLSNVKRATANTEEQLRSFVFTRFHFYNQLLTGIETFPMEPEDDDSPPPR